MDNKIKNVVIVGGGTAGWMSAASLSKALGNKNYNVTLIESETIGTVGVGEATIPPILLYNRSLGLSEIEFVRETKATMKLGIEFNNWKHVGHCFFHPFGIIGVDTNGIAFTHYWLRWKQQGGKLSFSAFSAESEAAKYHKFSAIPTQNGPKVLPDINYAYHFDAGLYAQYLRKFAERHGTIRIEGKITHTHQDPQSGYITAVELASGQKVEGDLFIDCSGFSGLLIDKALGVEYQDWSHWLPVNSAIALPTKKTQPLLPYTKATAKEAGWQWRIPLQHRTGNGYVYCDKFASEEQALATIMAGIDADPIGDPRHLKFTTGRRKEFWVKNCIAIGLSGGFLEPLESTSIHLIQEAVTKLLGVFPRDGIDKVLVRKFNEAIGNQYDDVKDFLIAHYVTTEREDTPFWRYMKNMSIPDSLTEKLALFKARGETMTARAPLFQETSWFAVLFGQGLEPKSYHPFADTMTDDQLRLLLTNVRTGVVKRAESMHNHEEYLKLAKLMDTEG